MTALKQAPARLREAGFRDDLGEGRARKKRILFVDDEEAILAGLRNLLRRERGRWEIVFASGGEQALAEMRHMRVDVVISDMRMPGMDGADLLERVREEFPTTARIVLSGHAEHEAVMRALPLSHQFLTKPCDVEILKTAIARVLDRQQFVTDEAIRALLVRFARLPSVPRTYLELVESVSKPDTSAAEVARIVESDSATSAEVLRLVNAASLGLRNDVATIDRAVDLLGIELIKGFALVVCVFSSVERLGIANFSIERARHHSLATAKLAKRVMIDQSRGDQAFAAGLVHDLGQIVLAIGLPAEYAAVIREARASSRPLDSVERERLGANHADVGAYLLGVWGLPAPLIAAVAYHHTPSLSPPGDRDLLAAVHIADALIDGSFENERAAHSDIPLDFAFLSSTATPIEPERWRQLVADAL